MAKPEIGHPGLDGDLELIDRRANRFEHVPTVEPVLDGAAGVTTLREVAEQVDVEQRLREYLVLAADADMRGADGSDVVGDVLDRLEVPAVAEGTH